MLLINNAVVSEVLTMQDCIDAQERAFAQLHSGAAIHRPRIDLYAPGPETGYFRWGSMEGANDGYFAIRMKSDVVEWPTDAEGNWTEEKWSVEPGTYCGLILLISTVNAEPLAIINDGVLQHMRVGGGAAIGVKHLARHDAATVGMLGSGGMARTFLEAFTCVRPIEQCKVFSPTREHREAYAREMEARLGIEVVPVASAYEAVAGADILSSCTDAMQPVYEADWIEPGMHVTNLGRREIPDAAVDRFDVVIRQGTAGIQMRQTDRFQAERGLSPAAYLGGTEEQLRRIPARNPNPGFGGDDPQFDDRGRGGDKPDVSALLAGEVPGRTDPTQVTFYRNVGNQGLQFSSVGQVVYRLARERGLGQQIPTEWFLQDIRD